MFDKIKLMEIIISLQLKFIPMKKLVFIAIMLFLFCKMMAQYQTPPVFSVTPDQVISCNTEVTLETHFLYNCNNPDGYIVQSIPFQPVIDTVADIMLLLNIDDKWSEIITLPFSFCFFKTWYSELIAGSNGVISFDTMDAGGFCPWTFSVSCPSPNLIKNAIFGVYHDIDLTIGGKMCRGIYGTAPNRCFVLKAENIPMFSSSCISLLATHQIVIYENTNIIDVYIQNAPLCPSWNSGKKLVGIQNFLGSKGMAPSGRNTGSWSATNEAWRFIPCFPDTVFYKWFVDSTLISTDSSLVVSPGETTTYVAFCYFKGCNDSIYKYSDTVTVFVGDSLPLTFTPSSPMVCEGNSVQIQVNQGNQFLWSDNLGNSQSVVVSPSVTTTYSVFVTDTVYDCTGWADITVNVISVDQTIEYTQGTLFAVQNNATYQWVDCGLNYQVIQGENTQWFVPQNNGEFAVIINYSGCTDTSDCYLVTDQAIENSEIQKEIHVYPNPSSDNFTLSVKPPWSLSSAMLLQICDQTGRILYEFMIRDEVTHIYHNLKQDLYYLKLLNDGKIYVSKLMILPR